MIIKDQSGKFELKVDTRRKVVYETVNGAYTLEDYQRYVDLYTKQIYPLIKGSKWAKCCDLRQYKTSSIAEEVNKHTDWAVKNGLQCVALVVESAIIKMQMNRSAKGTAISPMAFTSLEEADKWLKEQGF